MEMWPKPATVGALYCHPLLLAGRATQEEVVEINHSESCGIFTKSGMAAVSEAEQAAADDFKINNEQRSDIPSPLNSSGRAGSS